MKELTYGKVYDIDYVCNERCFGVIFFFETEDGRKYSSGDTYVADVEGFNQFKQAMVFQKFAKIAQTLHISDPKEFKDFRVKLSIEYDKFQNFWIAEVQ